MSKQWFDVDKDGLGKQAEQHSKGRLIGELIQNALDEAGVTQIAVTLVLVSGRPLADLTVEDDWANGSIVSFYNGDLYWPDRTTSGMFPDVARDNWHRAENAVIACQPEAAARQPARTGAVMPPPPAVPVSEVGNGASLKPLTARPLAPLQLGPAAGTP